MKTIIVLCFISICLFIKGPDVNAQDVAVTEYQTAQVEDEDLQEQLEKEFEQKENDINVFYSELNYYEKEKQEKVIWGIVIAVLIAAIYAVGIASRILKKTKRTNKKWIDKQK